MSPELRCFVILNKNEDAVLREILKGKSSKEVARKTLLSISNIKTIRRSLLSKFKANSTIHLIVLAILETKYFDILISNYSLRKGFFSKQDLELVYLLLQGYGNDEIASKLNTSTRSIQYKRLKFRQSLLISDNANFVKKCIEFGILLVIPRNFLFQLKKIKSVQITTLLPHEYLNNPFDLDLLNPSGFIYFDSLNRFQYTFFNKEDGVRLVEAALKALTFSNVSRSFIEKSIVSSISVSSALILAMHKLLNEKSPNELMHKELENGRLKINIIQDTSWPETYSKGQPYLVRLSITKSSETKESEFIDLTIAELNRNLVLMSKIWSSESTMGVLITFLHLDYFKIHHI